ncbi:MAG: hypothetical protein ACSHXJ_11530 [Marinomonas colpomeniae]
MSITKEYWNIPKSDDVVSIPQGTNLTVFVEEAEKATYFLLEVPELITLIVSISSVLVAITACIIASQAIKTSKNSLSPLMHLEVNDYEVTRHYLGEGDVECVMLYMAIKNIGNGPLIIEKLDIKVGDEDILINNQKGIFADETSIADGVGNIFRNVIFGVQKARRSQNTNPWSAELILLQKNTGLAAGESKKIISFPIRKEFDTPENREAFNSAIKISCKYKDLFDKTFNYPKA